ncbi:SDR family NAD(P)-dependent oxidoreductase [Halosolutus halophilus]|uniref:SDR family NAD(P)-dependent oxidoreductase n=1 Tax=Halosolutus halophilus TaxID=1552990 RepID=UPI002234F99F|nr:SDR family oxidoreductase [Halosolutus halophilus]
MLDGKTAVVTGGSSGIGRAIAQKYAAEGAAVVIGDQKEEPRRAELPTVETIEKEGGEATFVSTDVTEYQDVVDLVEVADREYGSVDIMVNNAGILQQTLLHETSSEQWEELMDINVTGVFHGSKAAIQKMLEQDSGGNIVNISSISGSIGRANAPAYCTSKGAVTMMTRQNAIDYGPKGIRVNAVGPGGTLTSMVYETMSEERREYLEMQTPLRRLAEPDEIAEVATFLASDMASYVNGHVLFADGGFSIS